MSKEKTEIRSFEEGLYIRNSVFDILIRSL